MDISELRREVICVLTNAPGLFSMASKALRSIDCNSPVAENVAIKVLRMAVNEPSMPDADKARIAAMLPPTPSEAPQKRDRVVQIRLTENELAYLHLMAAREAEGSVSDLIRKRVGLDDGN